MSAYDLPKISEFDRVAKHYKSIKPMKSKNHPIEQDIRPLGDRSRKWERVKKFSDNCYAFYDGNGGDNISWSEYHNDGNLSDEDHKALAPMLWTREVGGWNREILRVRNGSGQFAHNGRYSFLERALPKGFGFDIDNGKQYIILNKTRYYLPKSDYGNYYRRNDATALQVDDKKYLEFERDMVNGWQIMADSFTYVPPRTLVDKERKKQFKPAMDSYYSWLCVMAPMFREHLEDFEYHYDDDACQARYQAKHNIAREKKDELFAYAKEQGWVDESAHNYYYTPEPQHALIIMEDEEHPMRMHMAWSMLMDSPLFKAHESDRKLFRSHYNRWINKVCGFTIKIGAQVITKEDK